MNLTRYAGLPSNMNAAVINSILSGNFIVALPNESVKNSVAIPTGNNEAVYQLGWGSVAYFKFNGGKFDYIEVECPRGRSGITLPSGGEAIYTVATRGVDTCTAIAIHRGDRLFLMHFDVSDIEHKNTAKIVDKLISYFEAEAGDIYFYASYISNLESLKEIKFVVSLFDRCKEKFGEKAMKKCIINRDFVDRKLNHQRHIEFGVAVDRDTNKLVVFGDFCDNQGYKPFDIPFDSY